LKFHGDLLVDWVLSWHKTPQESQPRKRGWNY
jgi:hypothetical protein